MCQSDLCGGKKRLSVWCVVWGRGGGAGRGEEDPLCIPELSSTSTWPPDPPTLGPKIASAPSALLGPTLSSHHDTQGTHTHTLNDSHPYCCHVWKQHYPVGCKDFYSYHMRLNEGVCSGTCFPLCSVVSLQCACMCVALGVSSLGALYLTWPPPASVHSCIGQTAAGDITALEGEWSHLFRLDFRLSDLLPWSLCLSTNAPMTQHGTADIKLYWVMTGISNVSNVD